MRRLILLCFALASSSACADDAVFLTWNMRWFPSGRADLRRPVEVERNRIAKAGSAIDKTVRSVGWQEGMGLVVTAVEVRDSEACSNLVSACQVPGLRTVAMSRFIDRTNLPNWQQIAILSNLPVVESGYSPWQSEKYVEMIRGFSFAVLGIGDRLIACFGLHLKANGGDDEDTYSSQRNIYKREFSAMQILAKLHELQRKYGDRLDRVVIAGDFNTDEAKDLFVSEATLRSFYGAHFRNCFTGMSKSKCITHPGKRGYEGCTLDYILYRGFGDQVDLKIGKGSAISDHDPLAIRLSLDRQPQSL